MNLLDRLDKHLTNKKKEWFDFANNVGWEGVPQEDIEPPLNKVESFLDAGLDILELCHLYKRKESCYERSTSEKIADVKDYFVGCAYHGLGYGLTFLIAAALAMEPTQNKKSRSNHEKAEKSESYRIQEPITKEVFHMGCEVTKEESKKIQPCHKIQKIPYHQFQKMRMDRERSE